jgi:molybdopterin molybdotransferase
MSPSRRLESEPILPFEEAARIVRDATPTLPSERIPLAEARGRVLAETIVAAEPIPPFDASIVDGFAVRAADVASASASEPVLLRVVSEIPAGTSWAGTLASGECVRISTGAPLPGGADAVIPLEWTSWDDRRVAVERAGVSGANVRRSGEDVRAQETILRAGIVLRPQEVGLLAAVGATHAIVGRRPRVAIFCTGNELLKPDEPAAPGKIRSSNHLTLAGQVEEAGGIPTDHGIARDDAGALEAMLAAALGADVVITSGGVSVGDHDPVKRAFERAGVRRLFWRVAASPGKPVYFGLRGDALVFGLPGNPVSSMVSFECFVRGALRRMQGDASPERPRVRARLAHDLRGAGARRHFARVTLSVEGDGLVATEVGPRGSGNLSSMVHADALAIVPEGSDALAAGTMVEVIPFGSASFTLAATIRSPER